VLKKLRLVARLGKLNVLFAWLMPIFVDQWPIQLRAGPSPATAVKELMQD
jgi:hypothetical protein